MKQLIYQNNVIQKLVILLLFGLFACNTNHYTTEEQKAIDDYQRLVQNWKNDSIAKYRAKKEKLAQKQKEEQDKFDAMFSEENAPLDSLVNETPAAEPEPNPEEELVKKGIDTEMFESANPKQDLQIQSLTFKNPAFGKARFELCLNNVSVKMTYRNPVLRVKWFNGNQLVQTVDYRIMGTFEPNVRYCNVKVPCNALGNRYQWELV